MAGILDEWRAEQGRGDGGRKKKPGILDEWRKEEGINQPDPLMYPDYEAPEQGRSAMRAVGDLGAKVVAGVPQAAAGLVGLGGLVPGVHYVADPVSEALNKSGSWLQDQLLSDTQKAKDAEFAQVRKDNPGFTAGMKAGGLHLLENPDQALMMAAESGASIFAGGVAAKGLQAARGAVGLSKMGAATAGAVGEGAVIAGSVASDIAAQNPDDFSKRYYALPAGVGGAVLGRVGGKVMGGSDIDTVIARGMGAGDAVDLLNPLQSLPKRVAKGLVGEGLLEEAPQSALEGAMTNLGTDKPWSEHIGFDAVAGGAAGGVMGGGMGLRRPGGTYTPDELARAEGVLADATQPPEVRQAAADMIRRTRIATDGAEASQSWYDSQAEATVQDFDAQMEAARQQAAEEAQVEAEAQAEAAKVYAHRKQAALLLPYPEFETSFKESEKARKAEEKALVEEAKMRFGEVLVDNPEADPKQFVADYLTERGVTQGEKRDVRASYIEALDNLDMNTDLLGDPAEMKPAPMAEAEPAAPAQNKRQMDFLSELDRTASPDYVPVMPGSAPAAPADITEVLMQDGKPLPQEDPTDGRPEFDTRSTAFTTPVIGDTLPGARELAEQRATTGPLVQNEAVATAPKEVKPPKAAKPPKEAKAPKPPKQATILNSALTEAEQALANGEITEDQYADILNGNFNSSTGRPSKKPAEVANTIRKEVAAAKQATAAANVAQPMTDDERLAAGLVRKITFDADGNEKVEWATPEKRAERSKPGRVNKFEVADEAVDTNNEFELRDHLHKYIPEANREAVEAYVDDQKSEKAMGLRKVAAMYGMAHTTLGNAVRTAKEAIAAAGEKAGVSREYALEVAGYDTDVEVGDVGPVVSEAAAAQAGLTYRKGDGAQKVTAESDDHDETAGYDRTESSDVEGDPGVDMGVDFDGIATDSETSIVLASEIAADAQTDWDALKPDSHPRFKDMDADVRAAWVMAYVKQLEVDDSAAGLEQAILRLTDDLEKAYERTIQKGFGKRDAGAASSDGKDVGQDADQAGDGQGQENAQAERSQTSGPLTLKGIEDRITELRKHVGEIQTKRLDKLIERFVNGEFEVQRMGDELQMMEEQAFPPAQGGTGVMYSKLEQTDTEADKPVSVGRRNFLRGMGAAAALAASPAIVTAAVQPGTTLGRATAISEETLQQHVAPAVETILRGNGATNFDGATAIRAALSEIATAGPKELRALAKKIMDLMPTRAVMLTVDDKSTPNAHGRVDMIDTPHLLLFTAGNRHGLSYGTFLHEALHIAAVARYHSLGVGLLRQNDALIGLEAPAAAKAMEQFRKVWEEFKAVASKDAAKDKATRLSISEAVSSPDEFFVRALTDPALQRYMAQKRYLGQTLMSRFMGWVKHSLFGLRSTGTEASWLDAALAATDDLTIDMLKDAPDFERLVAVQDTVSQRSAMDSKLSIEDKIYGWDAPESVKNAAFVTVSNLKTYAKKATYYMAFGHDLADMVAKILPSAKSYFNLADAKESVKIHHEAKIDRIVSKAYNVTDKAALNRFLETSTKQGKWGFQPDWLPAGSVQVDETTARQFTALTPEAQESAKEIFKHGFESRNELRTLVKAEITDGFDSELKLASPEARRTIEKRRMKAMRLFDKDLPMMQTPYAPLSRFGNYVMVAKSQAWLDAEASNNQKFLDENRSDGQHYVVSFHDYPGQAALAARQMTAAGWPSADHSPKEVYAQGITEAPWNAMRRLRTMVDAEFSDNSKAAQSARKHINSLLSDLYLATLSETSARKHNLKRQNVEGSSEDMLRAFASKGKADSHFIAALSKNGEITDALAKMRKDASERGATRDDRKLALNEILSRHALGLAYQETPIQDRLMQFNSVWTLLTKPSYYFQNATQPWMMSLPMIARHKEVGMRKAATLLTEAYSQLAPAFGKGGVIKGLISGEFDIDALPVSADEKNMLNALRDLGILDVGINRDMGYWESRGGMTQPLADALHKMNGWVKQVETVNRVTTSLAAYRSVGGGQKGIDEATHVIRTTHGNYSGANAPRLWSIPGARTILQFRKFQFIQASLMIRLFANTKFGSKEEKAAAWAALRWTFGHYALMTGVTGLPGMALVGAMLAAAGGDDDEPDDFEALARKAIGDKGLADLILKGAPALIGLDMTGMLGAQNMLSILPYTDVDMSSRDGYAKTMMGLSGSFWGGTMSNMADGVGYIQQGDLYKGFEKMLPSGFSKAANAWRMASDGYTNRNGDLLMDSDEMTGLVAVAQAMGLRTTKVADMQEATGRTIEFDRFYRERSSEITHRYIKAYRSGDAAEISKQRQAFMDLQNSKRANGFKAQPLSNLITAPREQMKRERNTVGGVQFNRNNRAFVEDQVDDE